MNTCITFIVMKQEKGFLQLISRNMLALSIFCVIKVQ